MDLSQEELVVSRLIERGLHIAFAESCTAGLCAARLVNVANASRVLDVSFVTYANEAKVTYLGVSPESISAYGVVSEQVAAEMARGVAKTAGADVGVGISGIAGPSGGSPEKPVGTVCFGFSFAGTVQTYTKHFGDLGRQNVRLASCDFVFDTLCRLLDV